MNRAFTNILCQDVDRTAGFYENLLGMYRRDDFGWFVVLGHKDMPDYEMGILDRTHETVPPGISFVQGGCLLTFVVPDVQQVYETALADKVTILQEPTDMDYGQRRLLVKDPAGTTIDVSAPIL